MRTEAVRDKEEAPAEAGRAECTETGSRGGEEEGRRGLWEEFDELTSTEEDRRVGRQLGTGTG